ncbi:hypothetical protein MRX96_049105 [Rhipicephalus microplus]
MAPRVPIEDRRYITRLFMEGVSQKEIARRTGRSKIAITKIIRAFREDGTLADAKHSGRLRVTTHEADILIVPPATVDPLLFAKEIRDELSLNISTRTYYLDYTQSVLSSGRCSVSVWSFLSKDGLGPHVRIDGKFTAPYYSSLLQDAYALDGPFLYGCSIFLQDESPVHMARQVTAMLEDLDVRTSLWPPCGADDNPIENVWARMEWVCPGATCPGQRRTHCGTRFEKSVRPFSRTAIMPPR